MKHNKAIKFNIKVVYEYCIKMDESLLILISKKDRIQAKVKDILCLSFLSLFFICGIIIFFIITIIVKLNKIIENVKVEAIKYNLLFFVIFVVFFLQFFY
uniref:Uncharacterized protein n=1 Tax=Lentinula edodes TaxID=5353 RepID=A0A343C5H8_LENED|nr:hypothetical protein [Lentinula edodes]